MKYIYKFEFDETDWVVADSKPEALTFYSNHTGGLVEELRAYCTRLTPQEAESSYVIDVNTYYEDVPEDEEDDYFNGYKITSTMAQAAKDAICTDLIATTNY